MVLFTFDLLICYFGGLDSWVFPIFFCFLALFSFTFYGFVGNVAVFFFLELFFLCARWRFCVVSN